MFENLTEQEVKVCKQALVEFHKRKKKQKENNKTMESKKFFYGTIVQKKGIKAENLEPHEVGIIVGHYDCDGIDSEEDMYRVDYGVGTRYTGEDVNNIEVYQGGLIFLDKVEHLKDADWNSINCLSFDVEGVSAIE